MYAYVYIFKYIHYDIRIHIYTCMLLKLYEHIYIYIPGPDNTCIYIHTWLDVYTWVYLSILAENKTYIYCAMLHYALSNNLVHVTHNITQYLILLT